MSTYIGTKRDQQGRQAKKVASEKAPAKFNSRDNRKWLLRLAATAQLILYRAGIVSPENASACPRIHTRTCVELAFLTSELGVLDRDRIEDIAEFFDVEAALIRAWWNEAAVEIEKASAVAFDAACKRLVSHGEATVNHSRLVDLKDASRAFEKTPERDKALFSKTSTRPRINAGMPTLPPDYSGCIHRVVPDGPGTDRLTTAERKALSTELGVKIDTLRRKERDLSVEAFNLWADRHRRRTATKRRNEEEKQKRAGRRRRKPGKTAAVREYAMRCKRSVRWAWTRCEGLDAAAVLALMPSRKLVETVRSAGSEKGTSIPATATETPLDTSRKVSRFSTGCSDKFSDTEAGYPAFLDNYTTTSVEGEIPEAVTQKRKPRAAPRKKISARKLHMLQVWHFETRGRPLDNDLVRQWRHRRVLAGRLEDAEIWFETVYMNDVVFDAIEEMTMPDAEPPGARNAIVLIDCSF